jgi:hypothetical protein
MSEPSKVANTIAFLKVRQQARAAGYPVYLTSDPEWLLDVAICRRAGFEEPARAKAAGLHWLNDYSGKWNHHYSIGAAEPELEDFKRQLESILPDSTWHRAGGCSECGGTP